MPFNILSFSKVPNYSTLNYHLKNTGLPALRRNATFSPPGIEPASFDDLLPVLTPDLWAAPCVFVFVPPPPPPPKVPREGDVLMAGPQHWSKTPPLR